MSRPFSAFVSLVTVMTLAGAVAFATATPSKVTIGIETNITTLDPSTTNLFTNMAWVQQNVFDQLFRFDIDGIVQAGLAENADISADGKTITLQLRKNVYFHSAPEQGFAPTRSFDARDVIHTLSPAHHTAFPYWKIKGLDQLIVDMTYDAADPSKITFKLKEARPDFLSVLAMAAFSMRSAEHYEFVQRKDPAQIEALYEGQPVGTGPYRPVSLLSGRMELKAIDAKTFPQEVSVVPQTNSQMRIQDVLEGRAQVAVSPALADFAKARVQNASRAQFLSAPSQNINFLAVNMQSPGLKELLDVRLRQAISMVIDRDQIVADVFKGEGLPGRSFIDPANFTHLRVSSHYKHNLVKAKKLAAEVGVKGKAITLLYMTVARAYNPDPRRLAEVLKKQIELLGLEVRLATVGYNSTVDVKDRQPVVAYADAMPAGFVPDHAMYVAYVTKGPGFDIAQIGDNPLAPASKMDASGNRTPVAVDRVVNVTTAGIGVSNYSRYSNPKLDQLYHDLNSEMDTVRREALMTSINDIVATDLPIIPIGQVNILRVVAKGWSYAMDSTLQIERLNQMRP